MPWNIRKQKIAKIISTIISLLQKLLLLLLTNWSITKHKSKQHISKRKVYRIRQIFFFFFFLSFEIISSNLQFISSRCSNEKCFTKFHHRYHDNRVQIEFDGCGDDQELGDVQFPSQRHGTALQTAQRQFIAPSWESIGDRALGDERERELKHLVGGVARGESNYVPGSGEAREERALREGQRVLLVFVPHRYRQLAVARASGPVLPWLHHDEEREDASPKHWMLHRLIKLNFVLPPLLSHPLHRRDRTVFVILASIDLLLLKIDCMRVNVCVWCVYCRRKPTCRAIRKDNTQKKCLKWNITIHSVVLILIRVCRVF